VSKAWEGQNPPISLIVYPFSALTLLVGRQEGHRDCKNPASATRKDSPVEALGRPTVIIWKYACSPVIEIPEVYQSQPRELLRPKLLTCVPFDVCLLFYNYLRQVDYSFTHFCLFVCLSVCLSVNRITHKLIKLNLYEILWNGWT